MIRFVIVAATVAAIAAGASYMILSEDAPAPAASVPPSKGDHSGKTFPTEFPVRDSEASSASDPIQPAAGLEMTAPSAADLTISRSSSIDLTQYPLIPASQIPDHLLDEHLADRAGALLAFDISSPGNGSRVWLIITAEGLDDSPENEALLATLATLEYERTILSRELIDDAVQHDSETVFCRDPTEVKVQAKQLKSTLEPGDGVVYYVLPDGREALMRKSRVFDDEAWQLLEEELATLRKRLPEGATVHASEKIMP